MNAKFLEQHVKALTTFARETEEQLKRNPQDFWCSAALKAQYQAIAKASRELAIARAAEAHEPLTLRLIVSRARTQESGST